jgi:chemotaxis protein methyltransferase CheR
MNIEEKDLEPLLKGIIEVYGYDFSGYSSASLLRRTTRFLTNKNISSISELERKIYSSEAFFEVFLQELTVNVTELYRDPSFYKALRKEVLPNLSTYPHIKIWDAGCSTGEELYSLAILLKEENMYQRCRFYATDINQKVLHQAREGVYPISLMKDYSSNYFTAGGKKSLSDYYIAKYERAVFDEALKQNVIFSAHNLASDKSFNEFNLIVCRNVLIYFKKELQDRVIELFLDSLVMFGYLALGNKESLLLSKHQDRFEVIDRKEKIYRRIA